MTIEIKAGIELDRAIAGVIGMTCAHRALGAEIELVVLSLGGRN